ERYEPSRAESVFASISVCGMVSPPTTSISVICNDSIRDPYQIPVTISPSSIAKSTPTMSCFCTSESCFLITFLRVRTALFLGRSLNIVCMVAQRPHQKRRKDMILSSFELPYLLFTDIGLEYLRDLHSAVCFFEILYK